MKIVNLFLFVFLILLIAGCSMGGPPTEAHIFLAIEALVGEDLSEYAEIDINRAVKCEELSESQRASGIERAYLMNLTITDRESGESIDPPITALAFVDGIWKYAGEDCVNLEPLGDDYVAPPPFRIFDNIESNI